MFNKARSRLARCPEGMTGSYSVPDGVFEIGSHAFANSLVTNVIFPDSLRNLDEASFHQARLQFLAVPDGVQNIGQGAFRHSSVTNIIIGGGVTNIDVAAFMGCGSLKRATVGAGVQDLRHLAFGYCWYLTAVFFQGNAPMPHDNPFDNAPATIYYIPGTTGWGPYYAGRPTSTWSP